MIRKIIILCLLLANVFYCPFVLALDDDTPIKLGEPQCEMIDELGVVRIKIIFPIIENSQNLKRDEIFGKFYIKDYQMQRPSIDLGSEIWARRLENNEITFFYDCSFEQFHANAMDGRKLIISGFVGVQPKGQKVFDGQVKEFFLSQRKIIIAEMNINKQEECIIGEFKINSHFPAEKASIMAEMILITFDGQRAVLSKSFQAPLNSKCLNISQKIPSNFKNIRFAAKFSLCVFCSQDQQKENSDELAYGDFGFTWEEYNTPIAKYDKQKEGGFDLEIKDCVISSEKGRVFVEIKIRINNIISIDDKGFHLSINCGIEDLAKTKCQLYSLCANKPNILVLPQGEKEFSFGFSINSELINKTGLIERKMGIKMTARYSPEKYKQQSEENTCNVFKGIIKTFQMQQVQGRIISADFQRKKDAIKISIPFCLTDNVNYKDMEISISLDIKQRIFSENSFSYSWKSIYSCNSDSWGQWKLNPENNQIEIIIFIPQKLVNEPLTADIEIIMKNSILPKDLIPFNDYYVRNLYLAL